MQKRCKQFQIKNDIGVSLSFHKMFNGTKINNRFENAKVFRQKMLTFEQPGHWPEISESATLAAARPTPEGRNLF